MTPATSPIRTTTAFIDTFGPNPNPMPDRSGVIKGDDGWYRYATRNGGATQYLTGPFRTKRQAERFGR